MAATAAYDGPHSGGGGEDVGGGGGVRGGDEGGGCDGGGVDNGGCHSMTGYDVVLTGEEDGEGRGVGGGGDVEGEDVGDVGGDVVPSTCGITSSSPTEDSNLLFF